MGRKILYNNVESFYVDGPITASVVSASFIGDGSQLTNVTASYISASSIDGTVESASYAKSSSFTTSASYAITSSYASLVPFNNVTGKPTLISSSVQFTPADNFNVGVLSASAIYLSSSADIPNIFGESLTDLSIFTGSVNITGSLTVDGPINGTSSYSQTALNSTSASYISASNIDGNTPAQIDEINTGFMSWGGSGTYYTIIGVNKLQLDRPGSGYIKSKLVNWTAPQTTSLFATGSINYVYIDSNGVIGSTSSPATNLYSDNIVLFEVLYDGVMSITVKDNHPYNIPWHTQHYLHFNVGTIIRNVNAGANIFRVSNTVSNPSVSDDRGLRIQGTDTLEDHGVETTVLDTGVSPVTINFFYTTGSGKWIRHSQGTTFPNVWNNAGVVTTLGANKRGVWRVGVSKDDVNSSNPTYIAVMGTAEYSNLASAQTAITTGIPTWTNELNAIEIAQLGYVVVDNGNTNGFLEDVQIAKSILKGTITGTGATNLANLISVDTSTFGTNLSGTDSNVQQALNTLNNPISQSISASYASTASYVATSSYASSVPFNNVTGKPTLISSSAQFTPSDNFNIGILSSSAANITTLYVQTLTSSTDYASGSNIFGNNLSNTHQFTGSVQVNGGITGSLYGTASYALSSPSSVTSSYSETASYSTGFTVDGNISASGFISCSAIYVKSGSGISSTGLFLQQTGGAFGPTTLRFSTNAVPAGINIINDGIDLVDLGFKPSVGNQSLIRLEHRTGALVFPQNTPGEFQYFIGSTSTRKVILGYYTSSFDGHLSVSSRITTPQVYTQYVSSSGSDKFGSLLSDVHQFTGSVNISGSLIIDGTSNFTSSNATSASYAETASYALTSGGGGGGGGGTGIIWNEVTTAGFTPQTGSGIITNYNSTSSISGSLPSTAPTGSIIRIAGKNGNGWQLNQQSGQQIFFGLVKTTKNTSQTFVYSGSADTLYMASHGFETGNHVGSLTTTGGLPAGGLATGTEYWIRVVDANSITLHTTYAGTSNNTNRVSVTNSGTGTHTMNTTGWINSTHFRDCVELLNITANNEWLVISSVGNISLT